jgi:poly-gamma-glutamate synthesis protein (capsule biosynthesis protein)
LPTVGAGVNLEQARKPLLLTVEGLRLGIVAMAEREFNIAGSQRAGANPIDYRNFTLLRELRSQTDFLLVLLHAGTEMLPFPRPGLVELCRFLVDQGANAVIVQHTHCVGCHELYGQAPIVYGQGNGIFASVTTPWEQMDPNWFLGILVELRVEPGRAGEVHWHPYEQSRGFVGLRSLGGEAKAELLRAFEERSQLLKDPEALRRQWKEYCVSRERSALPQNLGIFGWLASVVYRARLSRWIDALTNKDLRWHMVSCESHRELLADCLRETE